MLFSFVIPTINDDRVIKAINSVKDSKGWSSYDCEIIVVINGCKKEDMRDLSLLFASENSIKIFHFNDRNIAKARNLGIQKSLGSFIIHVDSDCLVDLDYIGNLRSIIKNSDVSLLRGRIEFIPRKSAFSKLNCEIRDFFYNGCPMKCFTPNLVVRRIIYNEIGFFDEEIFYGEDTEWGCRVDLKRFRIYHSKKLIMNHFDDAKITKILLTWFRYGVGRAFKDKKSKAISDKGAYYNFEPCRPTTVGKKFSFKAFLLIYNFIHKIGFFTGFYILR